MSLTEYIMTEYIMGISIVICAVLVLVWAVLIYKQSKNSNYEFTLICTPEGYRRILAQCEVVKLTPTQYFNQAIDLMSDELELPKPDDVTVH